MMTLMSSLVTGSKIVFTPLHHLFRDLFRQDQPEHFDEQLVKVGLTLLVREVHHRS
jgi:hypothetical protein